MKPASQTRLNSASIVDQLYDVALDPSALDGFIDAWNAAGLDSKAARETLDSFGAFDAAYAAHLSRAEVFLNRGEAPPPSLSTLLAPFDTLAAAIVDSALTVVACNPGATRAFGLGEGDTLRSIKTDPEALDVFIEALKEIFVRDNKPDRLLKMEVGTKATQTLFQMHRLANPGPDGKPLVLLVTTQYNWHPSVGGTLEEVFQLTKAEQGVVRALVEGLDAKTIATERGTSEGTVRSQIKTILSKMNARSQSEVIRLVLSFRDVAQGLAVDGKTPATVSPMSPLTLMDWLDAEVWKPFQVLARPDGRKLYYSDMGPLHGAPVLYSHMGFCAARWSRSMLKLAFRHNLRIICPIRAGYGPSTNLDRGADVVQVTRDDTLALLEHLGITRLPYLTQSSDLLFAVDLAANKPEIVSEIIGLCVRPYLPGDAHYASMSKWHRFFLSTAKHAPHLLTFTAKAVMAMGRRVGMVEFFRQMMKDSPADVAMIDDPDIYPVLKAIGDLISSEHSNIAQAYTMELLAAEQDWSHLMIAAKHTPTWFVNGLDDPSLDATSIAQYREHYPWIDIEVVPKGGQFTLYQRYNDLIPRIAKAAKAAASNVGSAPNPS